MDCARQRNNQPSDSGDTTPLSQRFDSKSQRTRIALPRSDSNSGEAKRGESQRNVMSHYDFIVSHPENVMSHYFLPDKRDESLQTNCELGMYDFPKKNDTHLKIVSHNET